MTFQLKNIRGYDFVGLIIGAAVGIGIMLLALLRVDIDGTSRVPLDYGQGFWSGVMLVSGFVFVMMAVHWIATASKLITRDLGFGLMLVVWTALLIGFGAYIGANEDDLVGRFIVQGIASALLVFGGIGLNLVINQNHARRENAVDQVEIPADPAPEHVAVQAPSRVTASAQSAVAKAGASS